MMQGRFSFFFPVFFFLSSAPAELREGGNVAGGAGPAGDMEETTGIRHRPASALMLMDSVLP